LGIVSLKFAKNGKDNRAAVHDLCQAAGTLEVEATARGLRVHQMIGILPDEAREVFGIPEGYEAWTGIAIDYEGVPATLPDKLKQRELTPRQRKPLSQESSSNRCVFVVSSLAGIVLKLLRVSYPASAQC
jgi:hypothetical protein